VLERVLLLFHQSENLLFKGLAQFARRRTSRAASVATLERVPLKREIGAL